MVNERSATQKQLDDINAQIAVLANQISALKSTLTITSQGITNDANTMELQIAQLNDQLDKCRLSSPMEGTVLTAYTRTNEMTTLGKPLYKIADLSNMILRAYITGNQLAEIKINQK